MKDLEFFKIFKSGDLTINEMTELCKEFKYVFRKKGDKICTCGDKDDTLYLVVRGKVVFGVPRHNT